MRLQAALSIAQHLVGGLPVALLIGDQGRIVASIDWCARAEDVQELWRAGARRLVEIGALSGFPATHGDEVRALLVVHSANLDPHPPGGRRFEEQRQRLCSLAGIMDALYRTGADLEPADLYARMRRRDPSARGDLARVVERFDGNLSAAAEWFGFSPRALSKWLVILRVSRTRAPIAARRARRRGL